MSERNIENFLDLKNTFIKDLRKELSDIFDSLSEEGEMETLDRANSLIQMKRELQVLKREKNRLMKRYDSKIKEYEEQIKQLEEPPSE